MLHTETLAKPVMRVELLSHAFKVTKFDDRGKVCLLDFARGMTKTGLVRVGRNQFERRVVATFAAATADRREFRFHRNQFAEFLYHIARYGWSIKNLEIVERPMYTPVAVEHPLHEGLQLRDYQVPLAQYLVDPCTEGFAPSKILTLQTGKGKSIIDLVGNHRIGQRAVMVIKGMYIDKWIQDIVGGNGKQGAYQYSQGDLLVVRGSKDMINLMKLALADELKAKFILITSKTFYTYLKTYDAFNGDIESLYPIAPDDFYEKLGVGVRHIDEVHQEFHANYRQDMYTHVPKTISMSATLDSDDPVLNRFYEVVWPLPTRPPEVEYDRYIAMIALWYDFVEPKKIRTVGATGQYDHRELEKSLMRHKGMLKNYLEMIAAIVEREFVRVFEPGQSMLIYCGLTQMCTLVRDYLKTRFPELTVNRYTEEDSYEEHFLKGDVVVTTIQSAGTAVDRPNLRNTLMTVALSSKQGNIQILGRTRKLKDWPEVTPKFIFLAARNIPKHVQYTKEKFQKLDGKVLSARELQTSFKI